MLKALKGDVALEVLQFPTRNGPLLSMAAQHFSAIIGGWGWRGGGVERPNGFQVFLQSYESREGKSFRTSTWLWDIRDRIITESIPSLVIPVLRAATGVHTFKGNDQISRFKYATDQTAKRIIKCEATRALFYFQVTQFCF